MKICDLKPDSLSNFHRNVKRPKQADHTDDRSRFIIFCLSQFFTYLGLISSLTIVICNYISFRVTTKVDIRIFEETDLPSISICFYYDIEQKHGPILQETVDNHYTTRLTVKQLNDLLPTWGQLVSSCLIVLPNYRRVPCLHFDPNITEYLNLYSKCFRLFHSSKIKYNMYNDWGRQLVDIRINKSVLTTSKIGLFLNNPVAGLENAMGHPSFIQFDTSENNHASITFRRIQIFSKPYPYETNCLNYSQLDCNERKLCIHRCIGELNIAVNNQWSYRRYIRLTPRNFNAHFSDQLELSIWSTYCFERYPRQPCHQVFYIPELATQINSSFVKNGTYRVAINYPYGTEKIITYSPDESFVNFIVHSTSVIGIWIFLPTIRTFNTLFYWISRALNRHQNAKKLKLSHSSFNNGWLSRNSHPIRTRHQLSHVNKMSTRNFARKAW